MKFLGVFFIFFYMTYEDSKKDTYMNGELFIHGVVRTNEAWRIVCAFTCSKLFLKFRVEGKCKSLLVIFTPPYVTLTRLME